MEQNTVRSQTQDKTAIIQIIAAVAELEKIVQTLKSTGVKNGAKPGEMTVLDYAEQQLATAIGIKNFLKDMENRPKS